jgi:hypothetical protein
MPLIQKQHFAPYEKSPYHMDVIYTILLYLQKIRCKVVYRYENNFLTTSIWD